MQLNDQRYIKQLGNERYHKNNQVVNNDIKINQVMNNAI